MPPFSPWMKISVSRPLDEPADAAVVLVRDLLEDLLEALLDFFDDFFDDFFPERERLLYEPRPRRGARD
jgi:hypothetical protein